MRELTCTNSTCDKKAERVIALPVATVPAAFVAPYCANCADAIVNEGRGLFADGPALSAECAEIEGMRL